MSDYSKYEFGPYLLKGQLHEAVDYLSKCTDKKDWYDGYIDVFEKGQYYKRTDNERLGSLDKIYQSYYRNIFWMKLSNEAAEKILFNDLWIFCGSNTDLLKDDSIESEIAKIVSSEGYEFLGGTTQGFYGPYIWKSSSRETYEVELPSGIEPYTIIMMDGFISKGWLDFISFGNTGTGGWAADDGTLCCVRSSYENKGKDIFHLSFLKHEAQHSYDKKKYPGITAVDLEYRAKLVELIYWPDDERIKEMFREADNSRPDNSHSVAAYRIISAMSQQLFGCEYRNDENVWGSKLDQVKDYALELLEESNNAL